ncbi:MAG: CHAT domain-containing protein [Synechococcales cyanobacterium RU_4_20]|nr:CHAT domain-containing protein [Synechococcales cyanobacterium RU_4_20]
MSNIILIKIHPGSFEQGFSVTVEIGEAGRSPHHTLTGELPQAPALEPAYRQWIGCYRRWLQSDLLGRGSRIIVVDQVLNVSKIQDCRDAATAFEGQLLSWLDQPAVLRLQMQIHRVAKQPAQVVLQTDDLLLQRFPWELWSLLDDDDNKFDFAVSHTPKILVKPSFQAPVKILAVLGNSDQINAQADLQWLDKLPQAEVTLLKQPKRQIFNEALRDQSWGILFFAGHSSGDAGGQIGLNDTDALSFSELSRGLKQAVQNGLTLAILNSCDGMELAQQLGQAQLPYAVVMRELVPDDVAQLFLGYFLSALGKGEPLPRAMRTAREQLKEGVEHEFPCASWLPVLCQNAAAPELRWQPRGAGWVSVGSPRLPLRLRQH